MNIIKIKATLKKNLEKRRGHWPKIAREADVSYSWIIHVMSGNTKNPRVEEVQRVLDVLKKVEDGKLALTR